MATSEPAGTSRVMSVRDASWSSCQAKLPFTLIAFSPAHPRVDEAAAGCQQLAGSSRAWVWWLAGQAGCDQKNLSFFV